MDIYKTAISALLIAPIVGGFGIYTLHQYQTLKERAEEVSEQSVKQLQEIEAMLHDEDGVGNPVMYMESLRWMIQKVP